MSLIKIRHSQAARATRPCDNFKATVESLDKESGAAFLKEGSTTFFVLSFYETADMIEIDTATNLIKQESIAVRGNDVAFSVENGINGVKESVLVKNAASTSDNVKDIPLRALMTAILSTWRASRSKISSAQTSRITLLTSKAKIQYIGIFTSQLKTT